MGMSGFTENRTSGTPDHAGAPPRLLTWQASKASLPRVGRAAQDIVTHPDALHPLKSKLPTPAARQRQLSWPERSRRYELAEKVTIAESDLKKAIAELDSLGVS